MNEDDIRDKAFDVAISLAREDKDKAKELTLFLKEVSKL
jgi:hypothetical protein